MPVRSVPIGGDAGYGPAAALLILYRLRP